jgi:hypothetical protein
LTTRTKPRRERGRVERSGLDFRAPALDQLAQEVEPDLAREAPGERLEARVVQQFLDRRQEPEGLGAGVGSRAHGRQSVGRG